GADQHDELVQRDLAELRKTVADNSELLDGREKLADEPYDVERVGSNGESANIGAKLVSRFAIARDRNPERTGGTFEQDEAGRRGELSRRHEEDTTQVGSFGFEFV